MDFKTLTSISVDWQNLWVFHLFPSIYYSALLWHCEIPATFRFSMDFEVEAQAEADFPKTPATRSHFSLFPSPFFYAIYDEVSRQFKAFFFLKKKWGCLVAHKIPEKKWEIWVLNVWKQQVACFVFERSLWSEQDFEIRICLGLSIHAMLELWCASIYVQ